MLRATPSTCSAETHLVTHLKEVVHEGKALLGAVVHNKQRLILAGVLDCREVIEIETGQGSGGGKEAYRVISADELVETFSLAAPGKDFEVYSETRLKRTK
jgi:hypothetical protein